MIKKGFFFIFLLCVCACSNKNSSTHSKKLDFGDFTIETPITWQKINLRGVDSYVGGILIDSTYSANFDLGLYSSDLGEFVKENLKDTLYDRIKTSKFPPPNADSSWLQKIRKCRVEQDTIDGHLAKILIPINSGFGVTGIYFDSLWESNDKHKIKLNISANNLDSSNEQLLLQAFKTLKFNKPK